MDGRKLLIDQVDLTSAQSAKWRLCPNCSHAQIEEAGYGAVWDQVALAAKRYCSARVRDEVLIDVVVADAAGRVLGKCIEGAK